ncbi:SGNH/GDSL hydrolase family protein [Aquimonas voraii]|uniref:Lysophospholipase L1 n=1 Tax=Aquimonas voraii TaxID=265719 RepID=A0A1G6S038_9GAMM|nr:SGNH/GDSL hydrolase family protein [Aquimonas voraii]SDD10280.1 Lysophospholipase L1 [Aquimonas voraii]
MYRLFARSALFWTVLPLMLPQALRLKRSAPRATAAEGRREGSAGAADAPRLRLLALGDSPFEGVGIARIVDTLPVRLAERIAEAQGLRVDWRILAKNGATAGSLRQRLLPKIEPNAFDLILVSVGVNDVTGLTRGRGFAKSIDALLADLRAHSPQAQIVLLGIPPMQAFPLLPQPLRAWLGGRSRRLEALGVAAARRHEALHSPVRVQPAPELFASDGFHPSELGHSRWAEEVHAQLQSLPWPPPRCG